MILELQRAKGTLNAEVSTVVMTISGQFTVRLFGLFCNTGATNRLLRIRAGNTYIIFGDATNSPLKPGQTLEINTVVKLLGDETIQAWQTAGADVDYFLTVGVLPEE